MRRRRCWSSCCWVVWMTEVLRGLLVGASLLVTMQAGAADGGDDSRQRVEMPAQAVELLRAEMRAHTLALAEVSGLLAEGRFEEAAAAADAGIGFGSMGQQRGNPDAPGRHMPAAMHRLGIGMHDAANQWSEAIRSGDGKRIFAGYQAVMNACVSCHMAYRVR